MKLLIDTEAQEIEILESSSFLELKAFLEGVEGGIGYTIVSSKEEQSNNSYPFQLLSFGGDQVSPHSGDQI